MDKSIGEGGFSTVYGGAQQTPARPVAIKVFRTGGKVGARVRERFQRESAIIGELSNEDGLVNVFTGGFTDSGAPYLAMELCEGGSMADRIRERGPLPVDEVVAVGERIGAALSVVHERGISHRDVKPSNILLKADGRALLTDFGLSVVGELTEALGEESRLAMTEVYAPPERLNPSGVDGAGADAAGDQYSFALTLYAMLLGGSPFSGETTTKRALKALRGELEPIGRSDVPPELLGALRRALASHPAARWPSMVEFVAALRTGFGPAGPTDPAAVYGAPDSRSVPWPETAQSPSPPSQPWSAGETTPAFQHPPTAPSSPSSTGGSDAPTTSPDGQPQPAPPWYLASSTSSPAPPSDPPPLIQDAGNPEGGAGLSSASPGSYSASTTRPSAQMADLTQMPNREYGASRIDPESKEPGENPKSKLFVGIAAAVVVFVVVLIGATLLRGAGLGGGSGTSTTVGGGASASGGGSGVALEPPTIEKVLLTDEGLAFTWEGEVQAGVVVLYQVQVDGADTALPQPIDLDASKVPVEEQFVNSVEFQGGRSDPIEADAHEYCVVVRLAPGEGDSVDSEPKCIGK